MVINREWDLVDANRGAQRFFGFLRGATEGPTNVLRMMLGPGGLRPMVSNWEEVAQTLIQRAHREALGGPQDPALQAVLTEVLAYPDVAACWRRAPKAAPALPIIPVCFTKEGRSFSFFSTVTTLGTPQDVTAQELRIECFFPADDQTRHETRALGAC